ncbi:DUF3320 domain-containing protein [Methanobrevibacter sp. OttesenSCG-928-I08]|nr:DUF3320 domain-containing protein [Methanobrevibacter sp. OttesenSCG-928-I08]
MLNTSSKKIEKEFKDLRKNLLDLTLKNQLLNFKPRNKTLTVVNQSASNVYQSLVLQEKKMYFTTNKKNEEEKSKFSIWDHSPIDLSRFSEGDKTLQTNLTPNELQKRLFYINQQAKTMLDEQGYNILYLACGFLEWRDNHKPNQKNLAPLILIPVKMERKKVGKSFELCWTGEDLQTNISLQAKLKEDGIKLPEFVPKKYFEVVEHYIRDVKQAIGHMSKWNVNSNVALGFFSFTKFVMYNDLNPESWEDNVDLTKNELIEAIFNPSKNKHSSFNEENIDKQLEYKNMYQVLDADSSQIAAIEDVKNGGNLVVEGPPGTGKSQTIVNLIAELLAEGKSVLFVSEKMAALDVVKDRLTKVGLGKFVLELHSHKTRRKKFLKELEKATNVRSRTSRNIDQTLRKLETLKNQLDDYAEIIHKPLYDVNLSAFKLYGMKESADDYFSKKDSIIPLVRFSNPENITLKDLDDIIVSLESLAELYQTISNENPWSKCEPKSLLPGDLREIELLINDTLHGLNKFLLEQDKVYDIYGIKKPNSLKDFERSLEAFELIEDENAQLIDGKILESNIWFRKNNDVNKLIEKLEDYQASSKILDKFHSEILTSDIDTLINEVKKISNKKFSFFKNKQGAEIVEPYYKGNVPSNDAILNDLENIKKTIILRKELQANNDLATSYFGNYWHLGASIKELNVISKWMNQFNHLLKEGIFSDNTINLLSKDLFNINPRSDMASYIDAGNEFKNQLSKLESKLNPRSKLIFKKDSDDVTIEEWNYQLNNWRGQLSSLHLWSQYLNTKNALKGTLSEDFIDTIENRNIKKDDVKHLVFGNFADSLLNIIFVENQELATFIGEIHENRIKEFKDLDQKIIELNRERIFDKLNNNIPKIFGATDNPEAKILAGEFTRKSGHLPVRSLLEKAGGMIKQIKPCFMMSPLSIAQYLDPTNDKLQFDVVIFDEASQVKPEDALGAFMRGKTAVVMGDTQQLPPTSFFDQIAAGESGEEVAGALDMESILHLCKLSFPVKMLKWHYRSRHESLIAVSNKEFYDDELLVYPSPSTNDPELGLKFHHNPETVYDRGSGSLNRKEARDVVKEIFNHFDKFGDTKSLGVGTFSVAQKNAILEELEIERKQRPELEPLFSDKMDEKFFVKNLETIQGDERDVILISIGYGFDSNGKMSLNFGPLNQDGGERRLNVLVTRAREKCVVFSNFKSHDMKLTSNPPFGVKSLKEFLEYAENLTMGNLVNDDVREEPFEDAVYSFLTENGYTIHKQVGCAGFRVDLAIVDEDNPGKYILGIITDGKMYSSSKVARDRDRLREQVLNGLSWNLYRLWSTDWYRNRDLARSKLIEAVKKAKKESVEEENRKSEESKKLAEKLKKEAEKRAEDLRIAKEKALEEEEKERKEKEQLADESSEIIIDNAPDIEGEAIEIDFDSDVEIHDNIIEANPKDVEVPDNIIEANPKDVEVPDNIIESNYVKENLPLDSNVEVFSPKSNEEKSNDIPSLNKKTELDEEYISDDMDYSTIQKSSNEEDENESEGFINSLIKNLSNNSKSDEVIDIDNNESFNEEDILEKPIDLSKEKIDLNEDLNISEDDDSESLFSKIKFKSKLTLVGDDDLHSIASSSTYDENIKDELDEVIEDSISESKHDLSVNNIDEINETTHNNDSNIHNAESDEEIGNTSHDASILSDLNEDISHEIYDTQDNVSKIDYSEMYEGVSGIDNPLKKNTIYHNKNNNKNKSVFGTINDLKNEVKYINASLKEIENPTPPEVVQIIDRTEEYIPDNSQNHDSQVFNENEPKYQFSQTLKKELNDDMELENIIQDVDEDYKKLEKERFKATNKLKAVDDKKLPKKGASLDDEVSIYQFAEDIGLNPNEDIYSKDISSSISKIVNIEGPVHIDEVVKRIKDSANMKRAGVKLKNKVNEGIQKAENDGNIVLIDGFLYDGNNQNIAIRKREKPNIDLISNEEIEKNIETILFIKQEVDSKSLTRMAAKNFGFKSTSKKTASKINKVLDSMIAEDKVIIDRDKVELK